MQVFAARYCSCTHESSMAVLSLHLSPETAQTAVDEHRAGKKAEHLDCMDAQWQKRFPWSDEHGSGSQAWDVQEYEVLP